MSTTSSTPSKPSNSSVKPGEKTFLGRKRFSKNSYGSKNGKQEQTRNKVQTKVQTFVHVRQRNAKREETRNKVHHCSSRKTRAAVRKHLRQTKSEVLTPILKSRLGIRSDSQKDGRQRRKSRHHVNTCLLQISWLSKIQSDPKRSNPVCEQVPECVCECLRNCENF